MSSILTTTTAQPQQTSIERLLGLLDHQGVGAPALARPNGIARGSGQATQVFPRFDLLLPGERVALDIEGQDYRVSGGNQNNRLGWIAIVNSRGEVILDCHVEYPKETDVKVIIGGWSEDFGITSEALTARNGAVPAYIVEEWVRIIIKDREVVLHGGTNDLKAFYYGSPYKGALRVVDTQNHYGKWALWKLSIQYLGIVIQAEGKHGPVEDALATMVLWERAFPSNRPQLYAQWMALKDEEKAAYLEAGPKITQEHYQGNPRPMPTFVLWHDLPVPRQPQTRPPQASAYKTLVPNSGAWGHGSFAAVVARQAEPERSSDVQPRSPQNQVISSNVWTVRGRGGVTRGRGRGNATTTITQQPQQSQQPIAAQTPVAADSGRGRGRGRSRGDRGQAHPGHGTESWRL